MITIKEAAKIVTNRSNGDTIIHGFEYKNLYIFRMLLKGAELGSDCDYYVSLNKNTKEYSIFNAFDEAFDNPDEFIPASKKAIPLKQLLD